MKKFFLLLVLVSFCRCACRQDDENAFDPLTYQTDPGVLLDMESGEYHWRKGTPLINENGYLREGIDTSLFISQSKFWGIDYKNYIISFD